MASRSALIPDVTGNVRLSLDVNPTGRTEDTAVSIVVTLAKERPSEPVGGRKINLFLGDQLVWDERETSTDEGTLRETFSNLGYGTHVFRAQVAQTGLFVTERYTFTELKQGELKSDEEKELERQLRIMKLQAELNELKRPKLTPEEQHAERAKAEADRAENELRQAEAEEKRKGLGRLQPKIPARLSVIISGEQGYQRLDMRVIAEDGSPVGGHTILISAEKTSYSVTTRPDGTAHIQFGVDDKVECLVGELCYVEVQAGSVEELIWRRMLSGGV